MLDGCGSDVWVDDGIGGRRGLLGSDSLVLSCLIVDVGIASYFCRQPCMVSVFVQSLVDLCSNLWLEVLLDPLTN